MAYTAQLEVNTGVRISISEHLCLCSTTVRGSALSLQNKKRQERLQIAWPLS